MHESRSRRRWVGGTVLVLAIAVGGLALLFVARDQPGEQSLDEAVEEFRGGGAAEQSSSDGRPAAGVYLAEGEGEASLASFGLSQQDGPEIPITVVHDADEACWSLEMSLNQEHRQTNHFCRTDEGAVVEVRSSTEQQWDLGAFVQDNLTEFACEPPLVVDDPDANPGDSWPLSCSGTNSGIPGSTTSTGRSSFVGEDELEVGGQAVATHHHRQERTLSGSQTGDQVVEHWYAVDTGLLVREERRSEVGSDSPVGTVTYTEDGWWQLTSLRPRT